MTKKKSHIGSFYWDACVFLSAINRNEDRVSIIEAVLEDCELGHVEIYTSMLSIVEVAVAETEKTSNMLSNEVEENIEALWLPPSPIKLVEIHEFVLRDAKSLMRAGIEKGFSLRPADAIHLATAQRLEISEIHTYDTGWSKYESIIGCKITIPTTERLPFPTQRDEDGEKKEGTNKP